MPKVLPRHVICVLGNWRDLDEVDAVVRQLNSFGFELDREFSQLTPDDRMMDSFDVCYDRVSPSMSKGDWNAVRIHRAVAYVLSPPIRRALAADISGQALLLIAALLRAGAIAAKGESTGIAHGRARWLELAERLVQAKKDGDTFTEGASLYRAWVKRPIFDEDEDAYYSCGMHLLGQPDAEIDASLDMADALEWIDLFGLYLVGDRPKRRLKDGEGFRLKGEGPRRIMRIRQCERYDEDEFKYNRYGYIRLEPDE